MAKRKINLEKILSNYKTVLYRDRKETLHIGYSVDSTLDAMEEACRQILELAAENATIDFDGDFHSYEKALNIEVKNSIKNTINQIE